MTCPFQTRRWRQYVSRNICIYLQEHAELNPPKQRNLNISKNKQYWLIGPSVIVFMNLCVVITVAMVWWLSFVLKGFWVLCDNIITVYMVILLKEAFNLYMLLCENNTLKKCLFTHPRLSFS
jgi:hypothetical protein